MGGNRRVGSNLTCYMCDAIAVTAEHVPAKCFFPKRKDLPPGVDLRRNLFSVPSCDKHNSQKKKDDEYLSLVILATYGINECGQQMVRTKLKRSIRERPALAATLMKTATPAQVYDAKTDRFVPTVKVQYESARVFKTLDQFARALYCWHFKEKWLGPLMPFPTFALFDDHVTDLRFRRTWRRIIENANAVMANMPRLGDNHDAFFYQVLPPDATPGVIMRATFYGAPAVTIGYIQPRDVSL